MEGRLDKEICLVSFETGKARKNEIYWDDVVFISSNYLNKTTHDAICKRHMTGYE